MNYLIRCNNEVIGTIVAPGADPPMGLVRGPFRPAPAYQKVRSVFRLYSEATWVDPGQERDAEKLARYDRKRDALTLSVTTVEGLPVPVARVHVDDVAPELGEEEGYEAEFQVPPNPLFQPTGSFFDDPRYWDGFDYWGEDGRV